MRRGLSRYGLGMVALALSMGGCGSDKSANVQLVRVRMLASGELGCVTGGTAIDAGLDDDASGSLDDSEVDNTQTICNGLQGNVLVRTTAIEQGSAACSAGGVRIESGNDDGSNGGTATNGVLEDGEVDSSTVVCNDTVLGVPNVTPPTGPVGTSTIDTHGGAGSAYAGGNGGALDLGDDEQGYSAGSVLVFTTGTAATTPAVPALTPSLGDVAITIAASQTIGACVGESAPGTVCLSGSNLVRANASAGYDTATSLTVPAGVTVTFDAGASSSVPLSFGYDLLVAGTIRTTGVGAGTHSLTVNAGRIRIEPTGAIDLTSATGAPGDLTLSAYTYLAALGRLDVDGSTVSGSGYTSGNISLAADAVYTAGTIEASGGEGTLGGGGHGGNVTITADRRIIQSSATITANGGSGSAGAQGGTIQLIGGTEGGGPIIGRRAKGGGPSTPNVVNVINNGALSANAGSTTASCENCGGSSGGTITIQTFLGDVRSSGPLSVVGGNGTGEADGGDGGTISVLNFSQITGDYSVDVSGTLDSHGAGGGAGGDGGGIHLRSHAVGSTVRLYGYAEIDLDGGDGGDTGGAGGDVGYYRSGSVNYPFYEPVSLHFYTPIHAIGGTGGGAYGGDGGDIDVTTSASLISVELVETTLPGIRFVGAVTLDGGGATNANVSAYAGDGGDIELESRQGVRVEGAISTNGGSSTTTSAGEGGNVYLVSLRHDIGITASIASRGGSGTVGADGGYFSAVGQNVVAASFDVSGGSSSAAATSGGDGGSLYIESQSGTSTVGTVVRMGGTGTPAGNAGELVVDLVVQP